MASITAAPRQAAGLLSLPTELLDQIINDICNDFQAPSHVAAFGGHTEAQNNAAQDTVSHGISADKLRRRTLASLCRSCKKLARLATPRLYKHVTLSRSTAHVVHLGPTTLSEEGREGHRVIENGRDDEVLSAETPALFLRTLVEDENNSSRLRKTIADVQSYLLLRQQCLYLQDGDTVNDPRAITAGWLKIASDIKPPRPESYEARVLEYVGLSILSTVEAHATKRYDVTTCIPERIIAAILLLCTGTQSATLLCPPWHWTLAPVSSAFSEPRYTVLNDLLRGVLRVGKPSTTRHTLSGEKALQNLQDVTFTGMAGLESLERIDSEDPIFGDDPCPGSYIARGDVCPALACAPRVKEIVTRGTRGGWYEFMNEQTHDDDDNGDDDNNEEIIQVLSAFPRQSAQQGNTSPLRSVNISTPSPDHELLPFFGLSAFHDLPRLSGCEDTLQDITVVQTVPTPPVPSSSSKPSTPTSSTPQDAQPAAHLPPHRRRMSAITSANVLSPSILDRGLSRHAASLKKLDLSRCWHVVDTGAGAETDGPRPLRALGLLAGLDELSINLPLLATNDELWHFFLLRVHDGSSWKAKVVDGMARLQGVVGETLASGDTRAERRSEMVEMAGYNAAAGEASGGKPGEGWHWDLPLLRNVPASVRRLRITDRVELPRCAYWARSGEYGCGNGIPDFAQLLHGQDVSSSSADEGGTGHGAGDLARLEDLAGREHLKYIGTDEVQQAPQRQSAHLPADPTPGVEFAHKYLLPLALRRFAEVCGQTHPGLESVVVSVDRPLLGHGDGGEDGEERILGVRSYGPDELLYGAAELRELFATAGVRLEVVFGGSLGIV